MSYKLQTLFATAMCLASLSLRAQSTATFDDLDLPGEHTDYASSLEEAGSYTFTSGGMTFYGALEAWGGYSAFNYTNIVDTTTEDFTNDKAAIAGTGYGGSANYAVAYANADWPDNPMESIQISAGLTEEAAGNMAGMYVTNTTYAYYYIKDNYTAGDSFRLIIRGFLDGVRSGDSVSYTLARYTAGDTVLVKDWEWVDLTALGYIDSLTFQLVSTDDFTPFYFAIDHLTTAPCPVPYNMAVSDITANSATITWDGSSGGFTTNYQIAVDESATPEPEAAPELIAASLYNADGLEPNTVYYAHVRTACEDGSYSDWDTISFRTTPPSSLDEIALPVISVSPNPATDILHIRVPAAVNATVYGLDGRELIRSLRTRTVHISTLPAGAYLLRVTDVNNRPVGTARFIKN